MIITKSGRCLFPLLKFHLQLEPGDETTFSLDEEFSFYLTIERIDSFKWKFRNGHWYQLPGKEDTGWFHWYEPKNSSPAKLGTLLRPDVLSFAKVKLSNRRDSIVPGRDNYFYLSSFCNYRPVVFLRSGEHSMRFVVDECSFIAVTHYQNDLITHLKKHNNPHAKGFLSPDSGLIVPRGRPGRKRKIRVASADADADAEVEYFSFDTSLPPPAYTDDVIQASLALEKMTRTPRYSVDDERSSQLHYPFAAATTAAASSATPSAAGSMQQPPKYYLTFNHRRRQ